MPHPAEARLCMAQQSSPIATRSCYGCSRALTVCYSASADIEAGPGQILWSQNPRTGLLDVAYQLPTRGWSGVSFTPRVR